MDIEAADYEVRQPEMPQADLLFHVVCEKMSNGIREAGS